MPSAKILMIVTSHAVLGGTDVKTGFWLEELAVPYAAFREAGLHIDIASPAGGPAPIDPKSAGESKPAVKAFLADPVAQRAVANTRKLADIEERYDAYFVVGGHGVMWDLAGDQRLATLLGRAYGAGKVVAAVCHGPAALVGVRTPDGKPLVAGRKVAAFSNEEETAVGLSAVMPFALETRLRALGAKYERGPTWSLFAVTDERLVTGQNPASSAAVAQAVLKALAPRQPQPGQAIR